MGATRWSIALGFGLFFFVAGSASAVPIVVDNPSFEDPVLGDNGFVGFAPEWVVVNSGTFNPLVPFSYTAVPDGDNVAYSAGGNLSQVLSASLEAGLLYTLEVEVGARGDGTPFPGYAVQLLAGGVVLAEDSSLTPAPGTFETSVVTYLAAGDDPLLGQPLEIRLVSAGQQANFDNVRLDAIPEPGTLGLLGLGLGLLAGGRRLRRSA